MCFGFFQAHNPSTASHRQRRIETTPNVYFRTVLIDHYGVSLVLKFLICIFSFFVIRGINRSEGRVQIIDGDLYYSPNSKRTVSLPPPFPNDMNIFNYRVDVTVPLRWTPTFGWTAFVLRQPEFQGVPFDVLAHIPPPKRHEDGYILPVHCREHWTRLEDAFSRSYAALSREYQLKAMAPFYPWYWRYHYKFFKLKDARKAFKRSRDWFVVWMGLLSYLVAAGESNYSKKQHLELTPPRWFEVLANAGFEQTWLAGINSSTICSFRRETARAGVFIHFTPVDKDQPSIRWYCHYHVPVWYRWGDAEKCCAEKDPQLALLAPLPEQLQVGTTMLVREPPSIPHPDATRKKYLPRPWQAFFARRDKLNARRMQTETPVERQRRLARARDPPTISAKVFEWNWTLDEPSQLVREPVLKSMRFETLGNYTANQKRYDPFTNEWDCCEELDPGVTVDDDDEGLVLFRRPGQDREPLQDIPNIPPRLPTPPTPPAPPSPPTLPVLVASPSLPPENVMDTEDPDPDLAGIHSYEAIEILAQFYGFTPPLPLPSTPATKFDEKDQKNFKRLLGLTILQEDLFATCLATLAKDFAHKLVGGRRPEADEWDLVSENRQALVGAQRFKSVRRVSDTLFLFDLEYTQAPGWQVAVTSAADALYVCRLDRTFDQYAIARCLLQQGITFRTVCPLKSITYSSATGLSSPPTVLPIRLSGYEFTTKDYDAYQRQCTAILRQPRGRAALLKGGIVWRLAVEILSFDETLQGPSPAVTSDENRFSVRTGREDILVDDELTQLELNMICGAYECYTGMSLLVVV